MKCNTQYKIYKNVSRFKYVINWRITILEDFFFIIGYILARWMDAIRVRFFVRSNALTKIYSRINFFLFFLILKIQKSKRSKRMNWLNASLKKKWFDFFVTFKLFFIMTLSVNVYKIANYSWAECGRFSAILTTTNFKNQKRPAAVLKFVIDLGK